MFAVLFGVFAGLCWSLHDLVVRSFAARLGPIRLAAMVMLTGGVILTAVVAWRGTVWESSWTDIAKGLVLGVAYSVGSACFFKALSLGPISFVGPVTAGYPVLILLWGVLHGLQPSPLQWAAVAATLTGALIVARFGAEGEGAQQVEAGKMPAILVFSALAMVGYSSSVILGQTAAVALGTIEATWLSRVTSFAVLLPLIAIEAPPAKLSPRQWGLVGLAGVLDMAGLAAISASGHLPGKEFAGIGISAYGAIAVALAMVVLKERVTVLQWLGIVLIVGGVAAISIS